jgi:hypothetical protein
VLEWLVMEHYQFSFANVDLLQSAVACTAKLAERGATVELQRNVDEADGHWPMYKQAPSEWLHITIESTFATVRHRTKITRGSGSRAAGLAMGQARRAAA